MKYIKEFEKYEGPIYKKGDYVLIRDYKSNYIPGKIESIAYQKDYKFEIMNAFNFILLREDGIKEYYSAWLYHNNYNASISKTGTNSPSIERKLTPEEIEDFKVKLLATKYNL